MKTLLRNLILLSCILLLGVVKANAAYNVTFTSVSTTGGANGLVANPVPGTSSNYATFGFGITGSGATAGSGTLSTLQFYQVGGSADNNNLYFTTAYLYSCTTNNFSTGTKTLLSTVTSGASYTIAFSGLNIAVSNNSAVQYFFVVLADDLGDTNASTFQWEPDRSTTYTYTAATGGAPTYAGIRGATPVTGPAYTFSAVPPVTVTATSLNTAVNPAAPTNGLTANPIAVPATKLPIYGLQLAPSATGATKTITAINFTSVAAPAQTNNYFMGNAYLYSSTSSTYSAGTSTLIQTVAAGATNTLNFTVSIPITAGSAPLYYFVLIDYNTAVPQAETYQLNFTSTTSVTASGTPAGYNYNFPPGLSVAATSLNTAVNPAAPTNGLTANPIAATGTGLPIYGLQLTPSATGAASTITALNFTEVAAPVQNNNYFMGNAYLYSSTSSTYSAGTSTLVKTLAAGASTTLNFTGLSIPVTPGGAPMYYFVLIDYNTPVAAAETYQLSFTSSTGVPSTGTPVAGYKYNFPVTTVTATALGVTAGPTNGLVANPVTTTQNGIAIYGLQLAGTGGGAAKTITTLTFETSGATGEYNNYFASSFTLYASTSSTFMGVGAPQTSAALATAILGADFNTIPFTGLSISVASGATLYYFVVANYTTLVSVTDTYELDFYSATGATVTAGAGNTGFNYTFKAPTFTFTTNSTGFNTTNPYYFTSTGDVLQSFGVTSTAPTTLTTITVKPYIGGTANVGPTSTFFSNLQIFSSPNPDYGASLSGGTLTSVPFTSAGTTTQTITFTTPPAIGTTAVYFFIVGDFTAGDNYPLPTTFQTRINNATATSGTFTNAGTVNGTAYNLLAPLILGTALTTGFPPTSLTINTPQVPLLGFSVKNNTSGAAAVTETVTGMNFSAALTPSNSIGSFFSNVTLLVSTTNTLASATPVTAGYTVGPLSGSTLSITGLSQAITSGQTLYYFIEGDYTTPTANYSTTFALSATSVVTTTPAGTHTAGAPITGPTYTCYPTTYLSTASITGLAGNPIIGSQTGIGIMGFSIYSGAANTFNQFNLYSTQPLGNIGTYFANFKLYASTTNSFAAATQVTGAVFSTTASTTLTVTGISETITNATKYYFIVVDYTAPSIATTFMLSCGSVQTSTNTYNSGAPIDGTNYTLTGKQGVYYWVGNTSQAWETQTNWLSAFTNTNTNGYPGQTTTTDIAIFSPAYAARAKTAQASTHTISQILVLAGNNYNFIHTIATGATLTITNGMTLGDNTATGPDASYQFTTAGTGVATINGTIALYNDGQLNINGTVNFNSGVAVNMYGSATDQSGIYVNAGTLTANNVNFLLNGSTSVLYIGGGALNATGSTFNIVGFGSQYYGAGGVATFTGCTFNVTGVSNSTILTGLGITGGTTNLAGGTIVNLGTSTSNGGFTIVQSEGGTYNLTGGSVINCIGNSASIYNDYYLAKATFNVTGSTINLGSTGGADGANSIVYNTDEGLFNLNAGSTINMNGTNAEIYNTYDNSTGTTYYGMFYCASTSVINPKSNTSIISNSTNPNNCFTLLSDVNGSATISQLASGAKISGVFDVQRYATGGSNTYRNYRLFSSPVNKKQAASAISNNIDITYLGATATPYYALSGLLTYNGAYIAGPGSGFTHTTPNPVIYLYQESITPGTTYNKAFTSGKNVGIQAINSSSPYNVTTVSTAAGGISASGVAIPAGNAYLLYYIGNNTRTSTSTTVTPTASNITATGYINQGDVPLYMWGTSPTTTLTYTIGTLARYPGLTMVGNPYPSTIDLQKVYNDNISSVSSTFYELSDVTQQFPTYNAASGTSSTSESSQYIASGQGFYIQLNAAGTMTFKEDQKTPTTSGPVFPTPSLLSVGTVPVKTVNSISQPSKTTDAVSSTSPDPTAQQASVSDLGTHPGKSVPVSTVSPLDAALANGGRISIGAKRASMTPQIDQGTASAVVAPVVSTSSKTTDAIVTPSPALLAGMHIKLVQDSVTNDEIAVYFNPTWSDKFESYDSKDLDGFGPKVYLSSFTSDNVRASINALGDYSKGKRVKLYVSAVASGSFTLQLSNIQNINSNKYNVFLVDNLNKDSIDIVKYKTYNFNMSVADTASFSSRFVLAIEHAPVPQYQLISFSGQKVQTGVQLNWKTQNESDYTGFGLQKLVGNSYVTLDSLQSDSLASYNYIDQHPTLGNNIYRLAQNDINGKVTYSTPITIGYNTTPGITGGLTIYPNPSKSIINVTLGSSTANGNYTSDIYNTSGTLIGHRDVTTNSWTEDISSYKLGVYIIELKNSNGILVGKGKFVKIN